MCLCKELSARKVANKKEHFEQKSNMWDMHLLTHIQANIDDATPELLAHALDLLLKNGAIDAWIHPIIMKKGRPAHTLHCLCPCDAATVQGAQADSATTERCLLNVLFRHTTTLGVRIERNILRAALQRRFVTVQLPYRDNGRGGQVDVKVGSLGDGEVVSVKAEFEHCRAVAEGSGVPLKVVASMAERLAWDCHIASKTQV